jgi:hypothetical protein
MSESKNIEYTVVDKCASNSNYIVGFFDNEQEYYQRVIAIIDLLDEDFIENKTIKEITFENGSKILFIDSINNEAFLSLEFNMIIVSDDNPNKELIKIREVLN